MNTGELPTSDQTIHETTVIQVSPAFTKRQLDDVVEDERVRRNIRRHGTQRSAVERVLDHSVQRRIAEDVFTGVGDQLRVRVRQSCLYAVREAPRQINFSSVVKTLTLTLEAVVDDAVLRKRSQRLRHRAGKSATLRREARIN